MKLNTLIKFPDGRIGTICYKWLDGEGGVWGEHHFEMPPGGFGPNLPQPEFMLRDPSLRDSKTFMDGQRQDVELLGERPDFEILRKG